MAQSHPISSWRPRLWAKKKSSHLTTRKKGDEETVTSEKQYSYSATDSDGDQVPNTSERQFSYSAGIEEDDDETIVPTKRRFSCPTEIQYENDAIAVPKRRFSYSTSYKLSVIAFAKKHGNKAAARKFGPPPTATTIRDWRRHEEQLLEMPEGKKANRGSVSKWPELERDLKVWVELKQLGGLEVSTTMVVVEARRMARERHIEDFVGSPGWCAKFVKREGLSPSKAKKDRYAQFYS